jgi:hypothetical protein
MKKVLICVLLLFLILTAGIFADHPDGMGIGLDFRYSVTGGWGPALTLKLPVVPVYWGIGLGIDNNWFSLSVTGDYYIIDRIPVKALASKINVGWYLGIGGYTNLWLWKDNYFPSWAKDNDREMSLAAGVRIPIGLSWQPLEYLEVYFDIAPSFGLWAIPFRFPDWDINVDLDIRFWI